MVAGALLVATFDDERREIPGGWVAITDGLVSGVGAPGDRARRRPHGARRRRAASSPPAWSTPTTTSTRTSPAPIAPATNGDLFGWLTTLYPLWAGLDEEAAYLSAWVGLAELALGGCTTRPTTSTSTPRAAAT